MHFLRADKAFSKPKKVNKEVRFVHDVVSIEFATHCIQVHTAAQHVFFVPEIGCGAKHAKSDTDAVI